MTASEENGAASNSPLRPSKDGVPRNAGEADALRDGHADPENTVRIRVHSEHLSPDDVTVIDGIPTTKPARTLLDLATVCDDRELECALTEALGRGLTSSSEILAVIDRYPWHRGGPRLSALIEGWLLRHSS